MKKILTGTALLIALVLGSCKKDNLSTTAVSSAIEQAAAETQSIAVAASNATAGDSIYVMHTCSKGDSIAVIEFSTLPAPITDYLNSNYSGYTATKAYSTINAAGTVDGYVVIIQYNGNPVGIRFDAAGNFVAVLEQREGADLSGHGWHHGGCFDNRDGLHRDTLALSALPATIRTFMAANYPLDTLLSAVIRHDSSYVILSSNAGLYATVFSGAGVFMSHSLLPVPQSHDGHIASITLNALPSAITVYLDSTYPGYVFEKAFSFTQNSTIKGYCVVIDSNNTKYGLLFDAAGNFVNVKVIP